MTSTSECENENARNQLKSYLRTTSAHGLPRIATSTSFVATLFWTTLFGSCLAAFAFQAFLMYDKYNRHEKIADVKVMKSM